MIKKFLNPRNRMITGFLPFLPVLLSRMVTDSDVPSQPTSRALPLGPSQVPAPRPTIHWLLLTGHGRARAASKCASARVFTFRAIESTCVSARTVPADEHVMALDWSGHKLTPISVSINPCLSPVGGTSPPLDVTDPDLQCFWSSRQVCLNYS
jgi:hypothetical protein